MKADEQYTKRTTDNCLKHGRITKEDHSVICKWIKARDKYDQMEDLLRNHYNTKFSAKINNSTYKSELTEIKEQLRSMPESVSKVLIFRHILIKESELK